MRTWLAVVDRTAVLFLGLAAGAAIGLAFHGPERRAPAPITAAVAPPPPATRGTAAPVAAPVPAQECAVPFQQRLLATVAEGRPVRVGVFGDSFGDGVWSGLARLLPAKAGFDVVKFSQQATGFTRYKSLNLETHAREQLGDTPIDVAVVSYGANDTEGVIDRDGHYAALMSPGWQREIGLRVAAFVAVLRAHGAIVYWVGLPRMRKESFDADITDMNAFYAARMRALGVPFIDTRPMASDRAGDYAAYLPDPNDGHPVLMRADDGIHMSMNGYVWITRGLAARIRAYVDAARVAAGVTPVALAMAPPPAVPKPPVAVPAPEPPPKRPAKDAAPKRAREADDDTAPRDEPAKRAAPPRAAPDAKTRDDDERRPTPGADATPAHKPKPSEPKAAADAAPARKPKPSEPKPAAAKPDAG